MSYHIVSIDTPSCFLSCKKGQLTCRIPDGDTNSVPLEDTSAIIITSFSATIHSKLLLEAAKMGVSLILCEEYSPVSLVIPSNRSSDTILTRKQAYLSSQLRRRLWRKTIDAKCQNQHALASEIAPGDIRVEQLSRIAHSQIPTKESECARLFWRIFADYVAKSDDFRRERGGGGPNPLLNFGYAVLLSTVLQLLFSVGLDPTFGISHVIRERATPLAYDLMEPFRPCVDRRVAMWFNLYPEDENPKVGKEFRKWIIGFLSEKMEWEGRQYDVRSAIEGVIRSFRRAVGSEQSGPYKPWVQTTTKWAG